MFGPAPLLTLSDRQRRMAAAENLFDLFRAMQALPGAELIERDDLCYHWTPPVNPMFRSVWRPRLTAETADGAIAQTIAWYRERKAPLIFWFIDDEATPIDLGERLQAQGFIPFEVDAPCMVADLATIDAGLLPPPPDTFSLEEVRDATSLHAFREAFIRGYDVPEWAGASWEEATVSLGITGAPWRMYVGWLDGTPVATNILIPGGGVAGLFGVATVAAVRNRGIGSAITVKPLLDARAAGIRYGALFASELGKPVYERVGFVDTGARMSRYLWVEPGLSLADIG